MLTALNNASRLKRLAGDGTHRCKLISVVEIDGQFGKKANRWTFEVISGPDKGAEIIKVTGIDNRPGTEFGDLLDALHGRQLAENEKPDDALLVSQEYDANIGGKLLWIKPAK